MLFSVYLLLGLLIMIPSYGISYLLNILSRRFWLALPVYIAASCAWVIAAHAKLTAMEWFATGAFLAGGMLGSLTVRQFKRGNYRKFLGI